MTRHYRQWRARQNFSRKLEQLHFELAIESPRRVLDYLLEHAEDLLGQIEGSALRDSFEGQLARAKRLVATRHNLRLVKGI
jgi:predicted Zn-dependent protease with MMP-like domain